MSLIKIQEGVKLQDYIDTYGYSEQELRMANPGLGEELVAGDMLDLPTTQELSNMYWEQEASINPDPPSFKEEYDYSLPSHQVTREQEQIVPMRYPTEEHKRLAKEPEVVELPTTPTTRWLEHLKDREGVTTEVYLDTLNNPTVGVGHKVTDPSIKVGQQISQEEVDKLLKQDAEWAWEAALSQSRQVGRHDTEFIEGLASVNYQLGPNWFKKHPKTWELMKRQDWGGAAAEAARSNWYKQTPLRVADFQVALKNNS